MTPPRPVALSVVVDGVPAALRAERRWGVWDYVLRGPRWTKVPQFRSNDPSTWGEFGRAVDDYEGHDGIGFALGDGWAGADLDKCFGQEMDPRAQLVLDLLGGAYRETSPSGTGVKAIFRARRIGFEMNFESPLETKTTLWTGARYFAITGHGSGDPTTSCDDALARLLPEERPTVATADGGWSDASRASDDDLLLSIARSEKGEKFLRLWRGETMGYASHSEADLALCSILAWWTNYDVERVERLFRLSDLMRPKWNAGSYRRSVLGRACIRRVA